MWILCDAIQICTDLMQKNWLAKTEIIMGV